MPLLPITQMGVSIRIVRIYVGSEPSILNLCWFRTIDMEFMTTSQWLVVCICYICRQTEMKLFICNATFKLLISKCLVKELNESVSSHSRDKKVIYHTIEF